jgi:hypothetical protein
MHKRPQLIALLLAVVITTTVSMSAYSSNLNSGCVESHWEFPVNTYSDPRIYKTFDKNLGKYDAGHRGLDLYADVNAPVNAPVGGEIL